MTGPNWALQDLGISRHNDARLDQHFQPASGEKNNAFACDIYDTCWKSKSSICLQDTCMH